MLLRQQKLNQYLERVQYVDEYYRQYIKRLNNKITKAMNR